MSSLKKDSFEKISFLPKPTIWGVFKVHETGETFTTPYVWCDSEAFAEKARSRFNHTVIQQIFQQMPPGENNNRHSHEFQQMRLFSQD